MRTCVFVHVFVRVSSVSCGASLHNSSLSSLLESPVHVILPERCRVLSVGF